MYEKKKGFTLLELLAVIVILAIVALIAVPIVFKIISNSKKGAAKIDTVSYLQAIENYMVMHKVDPRSYPFEFEPGKTYDVEEINKVVELNGVKPTSGSIVVNDKRTIETAEIKVEGYDLTCKSSTNCELSSNPIIHIIVPEGWSNEKTIEVVVVKKGIGLGDKPVSYDGGNTWTDEMTKVISQNGDTYIKVKDKNGNEVKDIYVCTSKKDGQGANCQPLNDSNVKNRNNKSKISIQDIDTIPPICELEITGVQGEQGYYRSDIEAKISGTYDNTKTASGEVIIGSGVKSSSINFSKITEDGTYKITGKVIDNAGNKGECSQVVTKDTKKPTLTLIEEGVARSDGYESGLEVKVKCVDESGDVAYQTPDVVLNGGGSKTVSATCKDKAGNIATIDKSYNIYEYSPDSSCGYNSCANSACGTATGTRSTGSKHACGTYECGTKTCTRSVSKTCTKTVPKTCQKKIKHPAKRKCPKCPPCSAAKKKKGQCECVVACHIEDPWTEITSYDCSTTESYDCSGTESYSCPKYCTDYCNDTENYTYNKTCETKECGSKTCWHK